MKQMVLVFFILTVAALAAETVIPAGPVQGTWEQSGSPYLVMGNLSIAGGTSLFVNEGVQVIFHGTFRIDVAGRMLASGTAANPVSFTAQDTLNGWSGIRFLNNGVMGNLPSGFTHTHFSYGKAMWGSGGTDPLNYGGAIWASNAGTLTFTDCNFVNCFSSQDGSAIYAKDNTTVLMDGCSVKTCASGFFGGVFVKDGNAEITNCSFISNTAVTFAAAIYFYNLGTAKVVSCNILNNSAGAVAGIYNYGSPLLVVNSLFVNNSTTMGLGGGIGAIFGSLTVNNCTFANNSSAQGGAAIWMNSLGNTAQITNCIFWENTPVPLTTTSSTYALHYCSTQVAEGDESNIFGDPLFMNSAEGDFTLDPSSPCIDAGSPDITGLLLPDYDLAGLDRVADGDANGIPRIDIGCFEWQVPVTDGTLEGLVTTAEGTPLAGVAVTVNGQTSQTDASGMFSIILPVGTYSLTCAASGYEDYLLENIQIVAGQTTYVTIEMVLVTFVAEDTPPLLPALAAFPNPFAQQTELRWNLKQPVKLEIYNQRGQLVRTRQLAQSESPGSWNWDGRDSHHRALPNGIYLCRLSGAGTAVTLKLMLRK